MIKDNQRAEANWNIQMVILSKVNSLLAKKKEWVTDKIKMPVPIKGNIRTTCPMVKVNTLGRRMTITMDFGDLEYSTRMKTNKKD